MPTGQNWSQAHSAVVAGSNAARQKWESNPPTANNYITEGQNASIVLMPANTAYTPSEEDGNAVDWITGPGKPPVG